MRQMTFIGGGRVTRIMLKGFQIAGITLDGVRVSDPNPDVRSRIKDEFPMIDVTADVTDTEIACEILFLAVHPPVIADTLAKLHIPEETILVSLAPKFTAARMSELVGGLEKIARMIPNAPSLIGKGYNPVYFSDALTEEDRGSLMELFATLGESKEVSEQTLETYALLTAMGPTYLWYQLYELQEIAVAYGLTEEAAAEGIRKMVDGTVAMMFESGYSPAEVMDLVPVKPMAEMETTVKQAYQRNLGTIRQRITP